MSKEYYCSPPPKKKHKTGGIESTSWEEKWDLMYNLLCECVNLTGTCNIPLSYKITSPDGNQHNIGTWLGTQRQLFRKNKISEYHKERLQQLVDRGLLSWGAQSKVYEDSARWNLMYSRLLKFREKFGDCNVPQHYAGTDLSRLCSTNSNGNAGAESENNASLNCQNKEDILLHLGQWLARQRQSWRVGRLTTERKAKLQTLVEEGVLTLDIVAQNQDDWMQHYGALLEYRSLHGHCNVPYDHIVVLSGDSSDSSGIAGDSSDSSGDANGYESEEHSDYNSEDASGNNIDNKHKDESQDINTESAHNQIDNNHSTSSLHSENSADKRKQSCTKDSARLYPPKRNKVLKLGAWLNNQRHAKHGSRNHLRADRLTLLQALVDAGELKWNARHMNPKQKWEETYAALLRHCDGRTWLDKGPLFPPTNLLRNNSTLTTAPEASMASIASTATSTTTTITTPAATTITPSTTTTTAAAATTAAATTTTIATTIAREQMTQQTDEDFIASTVKQLQPFPGSVELSDGSVVHYFAWLQKQLDRKEQYGNHKRNKGSASYVNSNDISNEHSNDNRSQSKSGTSNCLVTSSNFSTKRRLKLTPDQVQKLDILLEKGLSVFRWVAVDK